MMWALQRMVLHKKKRGHWPVMTAVEPRVNRSLYDIELHSRPRFQSYELSEFNDNFNGYPSMLLIY